jgi:hypothetical protein
MNSRSEVFSKRRDGFFSMPAALEIFLLLSLGVDGEREKGKVGRGVTGVLIASN